MRVIVGVIETIVGLIVEVLARNAGDQVALDLLDLLGFVNNVGMVTMLAANLKTFKKFIARLDLKAFKFVIIGLRAGSLLVFFPRLAPLPTLGRVRGA